MNLFPLNNNVFYKLVEMAKTTASGLHLPSSVEERQIVREVTIVAHGPGKLTERGTVIPSQLNVGMTVLVNHKDKVALKLGEENLFTCTEEQILAILNKGK